MKEASGELSMTAVAAIAIGAIAVIFTTLILPGLRGNITRSTRCAQAFNCRGEGENRVCDYCVDDDCNDIDEVNCPQE